MAGRSSRWSSGENCRGKRPGPSGATRATVQNARPIMLIMLNAPAKPALLIGCYETVEFSQARPLVQRLHSGRKTEKQQGRVRGLRRDAGRHREAAAESVRSRRPSDFRRIPSRPLASKRRYRRDGDRDLGREAVSWRGETVVGGGDGRSGSLSGVVLAPAAVVFGQAEMVGAAGRS